MADTLDLKVRFDPDISKLEEAAKKVQLAPGSQAALDSNMSKAKMARDSGDLAGFKKYINNYINILKNAIGNMPEMDKNFKLLNDTLAKTVERLNQIATQKTDIKSHFVNGEVKKGGVYTKEASINALKNANPNLSEADINKLYQGIQSVIQQTGND